MGIFSTTRIAHLGLQLALISLADAYGSAHSTPKEAMTLVAVPANGHLEKAIKHQTTGHISAGSVKSQPLMRSTEAAIEHLDVGPDSQAILQVAPSLVIPTGNGHIADPVVTSATDPRIPQESPVTTDGSVFSKWRAWSLTLSLVISVVLVMYWQKGPLVICKVLIYLGALASMKGVVKMVQDGCSFKFPLFLTAIHFSTCAFVAFGILISKSMVTGEKLSIPSKDEFATRFLPIGLAFALNVAMNNESLVYSSSSFVEIMGATGPICTILIAICMRQKIHLQLLGPCFLVLIGCALTTNGDPSFSMLGMFLTLGATVPRAFRTLLQHMLLKTDSEATPHSPVAVLAWTCLPSAVIMFTWAIAQEGASSYHEWYKRGVVSHLTGAILLSCINACILNMGVLFVIKDLGPVGSQIVAQMKSVLVVLGGVSFLHEHVSSVELLGFALVMCGVYTYNSLESRLKAKSTAELETPEAKPANQ